MFFLPSFLIIVWLGCISGHLTEIGIRHNDFIFFNQKEIDEIYCLMRTQYLKKNNEMNRIYDET